MVSNLSDVDIYNSETIYPSLVALKEKHISLRKRYSDGEANGLLDEIDSFVQRAAATGAILDDDDDRRLTQSYLDYWVTVLYRAKRTPCDATLSGFDESLAPQLEDSSCPYKGLNAFDENDRERFFGRQALINSMLSHLQRNNFLAVVGPSGSGKSSLVLAGVIPELTKHAAEISEQLQFFPRLVPGSNPLRNLALAYKPREVETNQWVGEQIQTLKKNRSHFANIMRDRFDVPIVIVVDQFEEIFTLCTDDELRNAFVENLVNLVRDAGRRNILIVTMRSDYEDRIVAIPDLISLFEKCRARVTPFDSADLYQAIEEPAKRVGLKFEAGVVDALVKDILGEAAGLPLLQFALLRLWNLRDHNRITWLAYKSLGGARRALALTADEFYQKLLVEDQKLVKRILLRLARPSEGFEVTSNRVRRKALNVAGDHPDHVNRALELLLGAGLVRLTKGEVPADDQIEVAHEALIRNWPTLVGWLEDDRVRLRKRLRLTSAADQWIELGRDPGALWAGSLLDEALEYKESQDLSETEEEFVAASVAAIDKAEHEKEAARQRELQLERTNVLALQQKNEWVMRYAKRTRRFAVIFAIAALTAMAFAAFGTQQRSQALESASLAKASEERAKKNLEKAKASEAEAKQQREEAERQRQLAEEARAEAERQRRRAETQSRFATARAKTAEIATNAAKVERKLAENAKKDAVRQRAEAEDARDLMNIYATIMKGERDAALYQSDGKWDDALKKYEILLSIYEKINDATGQRNTLTQIAKIHHAKNDPEAESKTRAKLASVPRPAGDALSKAAAENRLEPAINEIRESKKNEPTKYIFSQDEINNVGYDLLRHRRFSEAIEVFKFNVELYPDDANPYDSLAEAYMKAGNTGQARNYYLKALELATKAGTDYVAASANTGLGELSMKAGNNEEARRHYLRGLELGTKAHNDYVQASANYGLGELSRKAGDNNEAIRYYKTALALATKAGNDDVNKNATAALKKLGAMP